MQNMYSENDLRGIEDQWKKRYILIDQIRRSRQKAYRAVIKEIDLEEYGGEE